MPHHQCYYSFEEKVLDLVFFTHNPCSLFRKSIGETSAPELLKFLLLLCTFLYNMYTCFLMIHHNFRVQNAPVLILDILKGERLLG